MKIATTYALLALLATLINLGAQDLTVRLYGGVFSLTLSLCVGTAVGLVAKYLLDKRYIFRFTPDNAVHDGQTFLLYASMGLATTAVFWAVEYAFDAAFGTRALRYAGGALGLAIGYWIKYQLDKRYVFCTGGAQCR